MTKWQPPPGTSGDPARIRTSLPLVRPRRDACPTAAAVKARPNLASASKPPWRPKPIQDFPLAPLMTALDRIEHDGHEVAPVISELRRTQGTFGRKNDPPCHLGHVEWTADAIRRYLAAREADETERRERGLPALRPVPCAWVWQSGSDQPDSRGATHYEQTAWGRRYASTEGEVRELRLLSIGTAKADRPDEEKAAAAGVLANGHACAPGPPRKGQPYRRLITNVPPAAAGSPQRVRVVDVGCSDGTTTLLLDWDQEQAAHAYTQHASPALAEMVTGTGRKQGSDCQECRARSGCEELRSFSPPLGVARPQTPNRPIRSVSISDLRAYDKCPAHFHLTRELNLRGGGREEENAAIRRGRAVDAWLNTRHEAEPRTPCNNLSAPLDPEHWAGGDVTLSGEEALEGAVMISNHAALCPLKDLGANEQVRVQPRIACFEPELDIVVIADPDLLHTESGGWVWRETKTARRRVYEGQPLMETYPQLALAVLMLASGVLDGDLTRSRVELEVLHPEGANIEELDPSMPGVVDNARAVIADLIAPWYPDTAYPPEPGPPCYSCEAVAWCQDGREYLATAATGATTE